MDAEEWWPEEIFPQLGDAGYFGITVPEEYGGIGHGPRHIRPECLQGLRALEPMRWGSAGWHTKNLCLNNIYRNANEEQRRKYLPDPVFGAARSVRSD